jgi:hypothetical protein
MRTKRPSAGTFPPTSNAIGFLTRMRISATSWTLTSPLVPVPVSSVTASSVRWMPRTRASACCVPSLRGMSSPERSGVSWIQNTRAVKVLAS